jgi:hypothetical protein
MKKLIIPAALILIAACVQPFFNKKTTTPSSSTSANIQKSGSIDNTRTFSDSPDTSFIPHFTALNVPENMKQNFQINPKRFQVLVGKCGTILSIPENAFRNRKGKTITEKVNLQLVEGLKNADIIKMNLGTMSDKGPLETGGMICVNAFSENGDTLLLADGKKIDVEIPTDNEQEGMKLWDGNIHADGSVSWQNPQELKNGLHQIPVVSITGRQILGRRADRQLVRGFGPVGFSFEKKKKTIYGWWSEGDQQWHKIVDYFYSDEKSLRPIRANFGDAVVNRGTKFGWYDEKNEPWVQLTEVAVPEDTVNTPKTTTDEIFPGSRELNDERFANTNIATTEFRSRIPFINQACDSKIMLCYTENPKRDLWKSDLAAAEILEKEGCPLADLFRQFGNLRQKKVNPSDPKTIETLNAARETAVKNYSKVVLEQERIYDSLYPSLTTYSFGMARMGWVNVDCLAGMSAKSSFFNVHVSSNDQDAALTLIIPDKGMYLTGYKRPNGDYSFTHGEFEQTASYPNIEAYVLAKSGEGKNLRFDLKKIILGTNPIETVSLHSGTDDELKHAMGNDQPKKKESERIIDDWYTKAIRSGDGCVCGNVERNGLDNISPPGSKQP